MTEKEKTLLLQDLCARLPYGVRIAKGNIIYPMSGINAALGYVELAISERLSIEKARPYLRPMSSMTEEEYDEFKKLDRISMKRFRILDEVDMWIDRYEIFDFLNEHHFDYHGLISRGFALEAPEGMYNV